MKISKLILIQLLGSVAFTETVASREEENVDVRSETLVEKSDDVSASTESFNSATSTVSVTDNTTNLIAKQTVHRTPDYSVVAHQKKQLKQPQMDYKQSYQSQLVEVPTLESISQVLSSIVADTNQQDTMVETSISTQITLSSSMASPSSSSSFSASQTYQAATLIETNNDSLSAGSDRNQAVLEVNTTEFHTPLTSESLSSMSSAISPTSSETPSTATKDNELAHAHDAMAGLNDSVLDIEYGSNKTDQEEEPDSRFMSFEEWKKQKVGKDVQPAKKMKTHEHWTPANKQINKNLNGVIGEDLEIDLEMFSGSKSNSNDVNTEDEGGKVYKDRFNYASFDCAATIVKTNSEAKGASSILNENKDSYLLNECSAANKFVTIELCQDILVDTVMVGNYEFFSSTFHKIRLSVSDRFPIPANGWKVLGEFEADNVRALQTFHIKNPLIWARYLRFEVLSHYGNEYYCPLSVIRVHGQTMMDEFKNEGEGVSLEGDDIDQELMQIESGTSSSSTLIGSGSFNGTADVKNKTSSSQSISVIQNSTHQQGNRSISDFDSTIVDPERISTLNEECAVRLPHLGIDQFLEGIISVDPDFCRVEDHSTKPAPIETREPTTQESIYKNIMKRLSLLESNASLSLLYIEEQSRMLSNAFTKLENRQATKFDLLVSAFNTSIHQQITQMKDLYIGLQEETTLMLKTQRYLHRDMLHLSTRQLNAISSELTFFRRLAMFNTVFILCLLAYVVATRETYIETEYVEDDNSDIFINSQPISTNPDSGSNSPVSPASSFVNMKQRKKKIKFSVSHKLVNGAASPINNGSFYFDPSLATASMASQQDSNGYNSNAGATSSLESTSSAKDDDVFASDDHRDRGLGSNTDDDLNDSGDESVELNLKEY